MPPTTLTRVAHAAAFAGGRPGTDLLADEGY